MTTITETIISTAAVITALSVLFGAGYNVYKFYHTNKKQTEEIKLIRSELRVLTDGVKGALEGLIEQGCNGPCKEAKRKLEDFLLEQAHRSDI